LTLTSKKIIIELYENKEEEISKSYLDDFDRIYDFINDLILNPAIFSQIN